jgi:hypothetical protein
VVSAAVVAGVDVVSAAPDPGLWLARGGGVGAEEGGAEPEEEPSEREGPSAPPGDTGEGGGV